MKTVVSLSAINLSQYRQYTKGWKPNQLLLEIFEKQSHKRGKKAYRVYFDYSTDRNMRISDAHIPSSISAFLREKNMDLLDYVAGTVKDGHGRVQRLGKVLSKNADLKKLFDNDPNRRQIVTASKGNKLVCLSMHPYDIAGMSTDRGWTSCMNLVTGANKKFVKQDVKANTLIAYLVNPDDKNINNPIMRLLLKKFLNANGSSYRYIAEVAYPDASDRLLVKKVQDWVDENINTITDKSSEPSVLVRKASLYDDGGGVYALSGIENLADLGFHKLEKALDKLLAKKQSFGRIRHHSKVDEESGKKLFSTAPDSIMYPNIRKIIPRAHEFWLKALSERPDRESKISAAFKAFKKLGARDRTLAYDIMGSFAVKGDVKSLQTAAESVPVDEFLNTGETNHIVSRLFRSKKDSVRAYELAKALAALSSNPDVSFWRILSTVYYDSIDERDELFEDVDESLPFYFSAYETISKLNGEFLNTASLRKAKEEIPPQFFKMWDFLLSGGEKNILFISYDELRAFDYDSVRSAYFELSDFFEDFKPKPKFMLMNREVRGKVPLAICFDKPVNTAKIKKELISKIVPEEHTNVLLIPQGKMSEDRKDIFYTYEGEDWSVSITAEDYDCRAEISEDPKTNSPMASFFGNEDDVEYLIDVIERRIAEG